MSNRFVNPEYARTVCWSGAAVVLLLGAALLAIEDLARPIWGIDVGLWAPGPDPEGLPADAATVLATATAILAILVAGGFVQKVLRTREGAGPLEDERDTQIQGEASQVGHAVLIALLLFLVLQLGIGGAIAPWISPNDSLGLSSPVAIAHAMLAALIVSECSRHAATIWMYRRSCA
jgi:hypothetical protein